MLLARLPKPAQRASEAARSSAPPAPAHLASAQPRAAPARPASARRAVPCCSPRHAMTAAESVRRVATACRRQPPRGSRGLTSRTRARLQPPQPVRSLTPARAAFLLLQSREPQALPSPRPRTRRSDSPPVLLHGQQSRTSSSASLSGTWCSWLCRRLSRGSAFSKLRRRRPWRRRARSPWKSSSFSSPA